MSAYVRYTDEAHAHMAEKLGMGEVVVRPTYEEASDVAREQAMMSAQGIHVTVIHLPHQPSEDPFGAFGSWGWKPKPEGECEVCFRPSNSQWCPRCSEDA